MINSIFKLLKIKLETIWRRILNTKKYSLIAIAFFQIY